MTDRLNVNKTADIWTALPDISGDLMKPDRRIDHIYFKDVSNLSSPVFNNYNMYEVIIYLVYVLFVGGENFLRSDLFCENVV